MKIEQKVPAVEILEGLLSKYEKEMNDYENSLSLAICEYYSNPAIPKEDNSVKRQYEISKSTWNALIDYGMGTKELRRVNPESVFHVLVFAYQGVRMYSRLMDLDWDIPAQIRKEIERLLLPEEVLT